MIWESSGPKSILSSRAEALGVLSFMVGNRGTEADRFENWRETSEDGGRPRHYSVLRVRCNVSDLGWPV